MLFHHLTLISLALCFPAPIFAAQCSQCDSYNAALKSCQKGGASLTDVGSDIDADAVHCMCKTASSATLIAACEDCAYLNPANTVDITVLSAWFQTCTAASGFGDAQAVQCWQGNDVDCYSGDPSLGGAASVTFTGAASSSAPQRYVCPSFSAPRSWFFGRCGSDRV